MFFLDRKGLPCSVNTLSHPPVHPYFQCQLHFIRFTCPPHSLQFCWFHLALAFGLAACADILTLLIWFIGLPPGLTVLSNLFSHFIFMLPYQHLRNTATTLSQVLMTSYVIYTSARPIPIIPNQSVLFPTALHHYSTW